MADENLQKNAITASTKEIGAHNTSEEKPEVSENETTDKGVAGDADTDTAEDPANDDINLPMDKIESVLNASSDTKNMTPQMRRIAQRQADNTRRVEESIKGTKANPSWFVPLFCFLIILGLAWAVIYYLTSKYPIPGIGQWNLAIAFAIAIVGFLMTMGWR